MFCGKCGNQLLEGAKFCAKCGNKVSDAAPNPEPKEEAQPLPITVGEPIPMPASAPQSKEIPEDKPKKKINRTVISILIVAALAVLGAASLAGYYIYGGRIREAYTGKQWYDDLNIDDVKLDLATNINEDTVADSWVSGYGENPQKNMASDSESIYMPDPFDENKLCSVNKSTYARTTLTDYPVDSVNIYDGKLYVACSAAGYQDEQGIHVMDTDGSNDVILSQRVPGRINVVNGWVYFNDSAGLGIYKTCDGLNRDIPLDDGECSRINVVQNTVYYLKKAGKNNRNEDIYSVLSMDVNGGNKTTILDADEYGSLCYHDGGLYAILDGKGIVTIDIDSGTTTPLVSNEYITGMTITHKKVFFVDSSKEYRLFVYNGETDETTDCGIQGVSSIDTVDDLVFINFTEDTLPYVTVCNFGDGSSVDFFR